MMFPRYRRTHHFENCTWQLITLRYLTLGIAYRALLLVLGKEQDPRHKALVVTLKTQGIEPGNGF